MITHATTLVKQVSSSHGAGHRLDDAARALLLAAVLACIPAGSSCQDDHAGHDHGAHEESAEEGGHSDEIVLSAEAMRLFNITTQLAERRDLRASTTVPARVSFNMERMAHIGTQAQGRVQEIKVRLGEMVQHGDLLLVIDSPEIGAAQSEFLQQNVAVEAARTNVEAAEALADVARIALERATKLRESNGISVTEFLERQGALRQAESGVRKAQADLRVAESARLAAENQLHIYGFRHGECDALLASGEISTRYEVRAPLAGHVVERHVTLGEVVDPSDEALLVLANMDELWVLGDLPERHVGRVATGTHARITMTAHPGVVFLGTVDYISPALEPHTRTATIRIVVDRSGDVTATSPSTETQQTIDLHTGHDHSAHDEAEDHTGHDHAAHDHATHTEAPDEHAGHDHAAPAGDDHAHATDDEHGHDHSARGAGEEDTTRAETVVEAGIAPSALQLLPGMFGQAELTLSSPGSAGTKGILAVPEEAIQDVEGGPAVFVPVAGEANTFVVRPIRTGPRVGRWVPVLSGLSAGDAYVATGSFILKAELGKAGAEHGHAH